jgi:hypothetical protein
MQIFDGQMIRLVQRKLRIQHKRSACTSASFYIHNTYTDTLDIAGGKHNGGPLSSFSGTFVILYSQIPALNLGIHLYSYAAAPGLSITSNKCTFSKARRRWMYGCCSSRSIYLYFGAHRERKPQNSISADTLFILGWALDSIRHYLLKAHTHHHLGSHIIYTQHIPATLLAF